MNSRTSIDAAGRLTTTGLTGAVPWWSFTKTVYATAALGLVRQGVLNLTEPVDPRGFTLAHLLRHEAGLPDYGALERYQDDVAAGREPWSFPRFLAETEADRLLHPPGQAWAYSNIGYRLVADLIEQASGQSLADNLDRLVFQPAGVTTARLARTPADLAGVEMGEAQGYHPGWVAHGLITGSTADAARVLQALLSGALLGTGMTDRMMECRALPQFRTAQHPKPAYGLGLMLWGGASDEHPIGHSGSGPGSQIVVYGGLGRVIAIWQAAPDAASAEAEAFGWLAGR